MENWVFDMENLRKKVFTSVGFYIHVPPNDARVDSVPF